MSAHLAQLRLAGFKSFADPATLDILPGLTGLVGPNGCGKSNLAEALRWAMGEGRAGALRGDAMDDLIFAGTRTRPGRDAAEVTLTLEGRFPPPFADETRLRVAQHLGRGRGSAYYQLPYLLTVLAQMRRVMEAKRSGVLISLFHASQQASTMAL